MEKRSKYTVVRFTPSELRSVKAFAKQINSSISSTIRKITMLVVDADDNIRVIDPSTGKVISKGATR